MSLPAGPSGLAARLIDALRSFLATASGVAVSTVVTISVGSAGGSINNTMLVAVLGGGLVTGVLAGARRPVDWAGAVALTFLGQLLVNLAVLATFGL